MTHCEAMYSEIENEASDRDYYSIQENTGAVTALKSPDGFVGDYSEESSWFCHPLLYSLLWLSAGVRV